MILIALHTVARVHSSDEYDYEMTCDLESAFVDYYMEDWMTRHDNASNIINEDEPVEDADAYICDTTGNKIDKSKNHKWRVLLDTYSTNHSVKVLAISMYHDLQTRSSVGGRPLTRTILIAACTCCAERHLNTASNESKVARHFGNIALKRLRRAVLAVKRELPIFRCQYKLDRDRVFEICEQLMLGDCFEAIDEFMQRKRDSIGTLSVSPGTRSAAFVYAWLSENRPYLLKRGKLHFIRMCKVSPNGFNSLVQTLLKN